MSSWLWEAMEWVKTTRKGAKEEKRRILLSIRTHLTRFSKSEGMIEFTGGTHQPEYTLMLGVLVADSWVQFST